MFLKSLSIRQWCRSGICTSKVNSIAEHSLINTKQIVAAIKSTEKSNKIDSKKFSSLIQEPNLLYSNGIAFVSKASLWSNWGSPSECESGCLYGESGRLREGSVGLKIFARTCLDYRSSKKCAGSEKKFETCTAMQCYTIAKITILEFANQICNRAKEFDVEMIGDGVQQVAADRKSLRETIVKIVVKIIPTSFMNVPKD